MIFIKIDVKLYFYDNVITIFCLLPNDKNFKKSLYPSPIPKKRKTHGYF